jgi:hypothetical protein
MVECRSFGLKDALEERVTQSQTFLTLARDGPAGLAGRQVLLTKCALAGQRYEQALMPEIFYASRESQVDKVDVH